MEARKASLPTTNVDTPEGAHNVALLLTGDDALARRAATDAAVDAALVMLQAATIPKVIR